jgi:capsular polysaccharide biosynthesis protein
MVFSARGADESNPNVSGSSPRQDDWRPRGTIPCPLPMTRLPTPLRPLFPLAKRGVLVATEIAGPLTRRWPDGSDRSGPPRYLVASTPDYAADHPSAGLKVVEVLPELQISRPEPDGLPAGHFSFAHHRRATVPPAIVAQIPNGRAVGPYGAVITAGDALLFDLSPYYGAWRATQHPVFLRLRLPAVEDMAGSLGVLTTRGVDNYYHFLTDVLPRVELLRRANTEPERFLVNRRTAFQRQLLSAVGIPEPRVVESALHPHIRAEQLIVPSLPDSHLRTPPWIASWLRDQFLPSGVAPPHRRLYVTRGNQKHTRRVENEAQVVAALAPFGFETIDPGALTFDEQVRMFSEAELVVGAHGAALTNLVFCPEGATIIELFSPDYVNVCFWALATAVGTLRYRYLVGDGRPGRVRPMLGVASDLTVDPGRVIELISDLV